MSADDFRSLTSGSSFPLVVRTRSGQEYTVRSAHTFWISEDYPDIVFLTSPGKGVVFLAIEAIDSVQVEMDTLAR